MLESFAEKLADAFIQGELCISDWSLEKGANIKVVPIDPHHFYFYILVSQFTLGPTSKRPMHIPLLEMTPEEASEHATKVFLDVSILTRRILTSQLIQKSFFRLPCTHGRGNAKFMLQPVNIQQ